MTYVTKQVQNLRTTSNRASAYIIYETETGYADGNYTIERDKYEQDAIEKLRKYWDQARSKYHHEVIYLKKGLKIIDNEFLPRIDDGVTDYDFNTEYDYNPA